MLVVGGVLLNIIKRVDRKHLAVAAEGREVAQDLVPRVYISICTSINAGLDDVRRREAPLP